MTHVRNTWYVAAWAEEIAPARLIPVRILDEPIVLWRDATGHLVGLEDRCVHRLAPLSLGRCEGESLRCMYHGFVYDHEGRVIEIPGEKRVPQNLRLRKYPVAERYGWVWIWMGEPAAASPALIPPLLGTAEREYVTAHGQLDYEAEARLVVDNLLDLSHVSFLHEKTFRMTDTWARERPTVTERERSVHSERWIRNQGVMGSVDTTHLVDTYFSYEVFVPGIVLMNVRTYPVGTADALKGRAPDLGPVAEEFTTQAVTPLSDKSARYFYIMGQRDRGDHTGYDLTNTENAFTEDKRMIEAQQRNIDLAPERRFITTSADRGAVIFSRLVETLAGREILEDQCAPAGQRTRALPDS
jgi:phenylpropionate dioxygenase-like ring-hydroxylating dioxygenase large terminal subunit